MTGALTPARCKVCNTRACDTDGRGTVAWVCRKCNQYNVLRPRVSLPPLVRKGSLPQR